ncbi:hypothetical protein JAK34_10365 [Stenotrophomonas maltophilia]|nr:hypothetical protein [Stenotrophomonas maltophilia]
MSINDTDSIPLHGWRTIPLKDMPTAKADLKLIVHTCLEVIRDCPDPALRVEAAELLAFASVRLCRRNFQ